MNFVVYRLKSPSGKCYIGYTNNFMRRMRQHHYDALAGKKDTFLTRAVRKYGWENFTREIVASADNLNEILQLECQWAAPWYAPVGYNTASAGGVSPALNPMVAAKISARKMGHHVSPETRIKISNACRGKPLKLTPAAYKKSAESRRGAKRTLEMRQRMSLAHTGTTMTSETRQRMSVAQKIRRLRESDPLLHESTQ